MKNLEVQLVRPPVTVGPGRMHHRALARALVVSFCVHVSLQLFLWISSFRKLLFDFWCCRRVFNCLSRARERLPRNAQARMPEPVMRSSIGFREVWTRTMAPGLHQVQSY